MARASSKPRKQASTRAANTNKKQHIADFNYYLVRSARKQVSTYKVTAEFPINNPAVRKVFAYGNDIKTPLELMEPTDVNPLKPRMQQASTTAEAEEARTTEN